MAYRDRDPPRGASVRSTAALLTSWVYALYPFGAPSTSWAAFICSLALLSLTYAPAAEAAAEAKATAQADNTAGGSRRPLAGLAACSVVLLIACVSEVDDPFVSGLAASEKGRLPGVTTPAHRPPWTI